MPDTRHDLDEFVQRSTQVEVPAEVEARLHRRLAEFRQKVEQRPPSRLRALANSFIYPSSFRVPAMMAALLAVVAIALVLAPRGPNGGRVYAAAASQLKSAHSLTYTVVLAPYTEIEFTYLAPGYRRVNCSWGTELRTDGSGRQMVLIHTSRNYAIEEGKQPDFTDMVEQFKSLPRTADESLGEQWAGGRKLIGYRVHPSSSEMPGADLGRSAMDLWVDAATSDPDHADISIQEPGKPLYQMHVNNIRVNAEIDRSLFDMTPPAGYAKLGTPENGELVHPLGGQHGDLRPEIKQAKAMTAVVVSMQGSFGQSAGAVQVVAAQLKKMGVAPVGPAFGRYEPEHHWEAGFPVPPGTRVAAPFETLSLPETSIASVVVTGPWGQDFDSPWGHDSGSRWATFVRWIAGQGYLPSGPPMEFWSGDAAHPQAQTTEMRIAVAKAK